MAYRVKIETVMGPAWLATDKLDHEDGSAFKLASSERKDAAAFSMAGPAIAACERLRNMAVQGVLSVNVVQGISDRPVNRTDGTTSGPKPYHCNQSESYKAAQGLVKSMRERADKVEKFLTSLDTMPQPSDHKEAAIGISVIVGLILMSGELADNDVIRTMAKEAGIPMPQGRNR